MSLCATRWAWKQEVSSSQKLVLLAFSDRADDSHTCYPSITRLCMDTGLNKKTVMVSIDDLEKAGKVKVLRTKGEVNRYVLMVNEQPVPKPEPVPKLVLVPETVQDQYQNRDDHQYQNRDTESTKESTKKQSCVFETVFWPSYPLKKSKAESKKAFDKAIKKTTIEVMLKAIACQKQSKQWLGGFIPHASTWLNQERWEDEVEAQQQPKQRIPSL